MTRSTLRATLRRLYLVLGLVLAISLLAKIADHVPGLAGTGLEAVLKDIYEYLRDMALLIATGGAAYIANVFQKRSKFVESLEKEWRGIVATKSTLYAFCETPEPSAEQYLAAFCRISEAIDNMRIVYRNVGETDELVGLYPYAPLHDMRRALQSLDPRKRTNIAVAERKLVRDAVLQSFYALRETFLDELDLEPPSHALLISNARRRKQSGAPSRARRQQERQARLQEKADGSNPEIDALHQRLYAEEQSKGRTGNSPPTTPPGRPRLVRDAAKPQ
jgi:hypothetical protein